MDLASRLAPGLRERKKRATRHALSSAALRLVVARGVDNVRREDIAEEANTSLRTFANYFASKEDAIVALGVDRAANIVLALRARPAAEPLPVALAAAYASQYAAAVAPDSAWLAQVRLIVATPELRGAYLKAMSEIEQQLAAAIADRTGRDVISDFAPRVIAAAACAAERAAIAYWLRDPEAVSLPALLERAIGLIACPWTETL